MAFFMPGKDKLRQMKPPTNKPTAIRAKLLDIEFFTGPAQRILCRQKRPVAQLIVVTSGIYRATVDTGHGRQQICAEAGDVVLWPAGSENTDASEPGKPLHCFSIWFRWSGMPAHLPFTVRDVNHALDLLANRLLDRAHDPLRKGVLDAVAHAYLAAMLAEFIALAEAAAEDLVAHVAHYIEEHMREPIRRAELARYVDMDPHHFGRVYKRITGHTPIQDVRRRKAAYAKHVLQLSPDRPLIQVAKFAGVRDASKLSRLLKQYTGVSARDIKKAARRAVPPKKRGKKNKAAQKR